MRDINVNQTLKWVTRGHHATVLGKGVIRQDKPNALPRGVRGDRKSRYGIITLKQKRANFGSFFWIFPDCEKINSPAARSLCSRPEIVKYLTVGNFRANFLAEIRRV